MRTPHFRCTVLCVPYAKNTVTTCTGCGVRFITTAPHAAQPNHFHSRKCKVDWQTGRPRSDRGSKAIEKSCAFCGKRFLLGGRDASGKRLPHKDALFHSRLCALRARDYAGQVCARLAPHDMDWLAGYFDGEGSAFIVVEGERKRPFPQVTIGATDRAAIEAVKHVTAVGSISVRKATDKNHRDLYMWRCFASAAIGLLKQLLPVVTIKYAVADFVLSACQEMMNQPTLAYHPAWRQAVLQMSRNLNKRGPEGVRLRDSLIPSRQA